MDPGIGDASGDASGGGLETARGDTPLDARGGGAEDLSADAGAGGTVRAGLLGVVLCGGKSRRMGSDKGLLTRDGKCWAAIMGEKLSTAGLSLVYSIREEQEAAYTAALRGVMIRDTPEAIGPLRGVLSVHAAFPDKDLLAVACDMIDLAADTIGGLIDAYTTSPGFDFYIYYEGEFAQPFCGIYTARGLAGWANAVRHGEAGNSGFQFLLRRDTERVKRLVITDPSSFRNYNSLG